MNNTAQGPTEDGVRSRESVLKAILLYTGVLGSLTVGGAFLLTRSAGVVLVLAVVGLTLVVFVGGTGDASSSSAAVQADHVGGVAGDAEGGHGWTPGGQVTESWGEAALLYGFGLLVWGVLGLVLFPGTPV